MSAMATILTASQRLSPLATLSLVGLLPRQQLDGDPEQQQAADQLQPGQLEEVLHDDGEDDAQHDGRAGTENDAASRAGAAAARGTPAR